MLTESRKKFLRDILLTAVCGGINYWAQVRKDANIEDLYWLRELEPPPMTTRRRSIDLATIEVGIAKVATKDFEVGTDLRAGILVGNVMEDATDIDVDAADVIIQAALFGEIIYG